MQQGLFDRGIAVYPLMAENSTDAISELGARMAAEGYVNERYIASVIAREADFPTGLQLAATAIAIPHATPDGNVERDGIAVGRLAQPVTFRSMENPDETVAAELVFMLALKDSSAHLEVLQRLFTGFQNSQLVQALKDSQSSAELVEVLQTNL